VALLPLDPIPLLAAAGDPVRWSILRELAAGPPLIVLELARRLGKSADLISKHLRVLRDCGAVIVGTPPGEDGRKSFYEVPAAYRPAPRVLDYRSCVLRF
jgi:DNA-binding transcriptional ArsR family regulator